jgi:uracil-DNA glycosylase
MEAFKINKDWADFLEDELNNEQFISLHKKIEREYKSFSIFPKYTEIFDAFNYCPLSSLKVVIIGQDPYPTAGNANGLAFSTNNKNKIPASIQNIFKEIANEFNITQSRDPNLQRWSSQGVLLLNTILTVRENSAGSHHKIGWEKFSEKIVQKISNDFENIVFILWGKFAIGKKVFIDENKHLVLESVHPSPLSAYRGFFGNNHFLECNNYLKNNNKIEIDWR